MGIDVEAKLVHVPVEAGSEQSNLLKENGKMNHGSGITEPIKFGSHGTEEPKKEEVSRTPVSNVPKEIESKEANQLLILLVQALCRNYQIPLTID